MHGVTGCHGPMWQTSLATNYYNRIFALFISDWCKFDQSYAKALAVLYPGSCKVLQEATEAITEWKDTSRGLVITIV